MVDAATTMMLADLDEVLRSLLEEELTSRGITNANLTFDTPTRENAARWPSPTIDLFLYDLRESATLRDHSLHPRLVDGTPALARSALRLECTYAIAAWAQSALDEHRLLSQVISILCVHPRLPIDELSPASLRVGEPPAQLPTALARPREHARAEFWSAMGGGYKLSIDYTVTLLYDPKLSYERGPPVVTENLSIADVHVDGRESTATVDAASMPERAGAFARNFARPLLARRFRDG